MAVLILLLIFLSLLIGFILFDRVLKFQHSNHRSTWKSDGKPIGFFWIPEGSSFLQGSFQRNIQALSWTFGNQEWMEKEPSVLKKLWIMRACIFSAWLLMILLAVLKLSH
jgi:hypothetical protein